MHYQHLKITRKAVRYIVPILPVIIALFLIAYKVEMPRFLREVGLASALPFWKIQNTFSVSENTTQKNLENEVNTLRREVFGLRALERDSEHLRELLGRPKEGSPMVPVSVIHDNSFSPYDTFIIDRGAKDGIREGMLIVTPEHIALGYAKAVHERMTTVSLFSAPDMLFDAVILATTSTHAKITGHGAGTMKVSIPRDIEIEIDTPVVLPSFETYTIGTIASVESTPEDAHKNVYIRTPVNIYGLRFVLVDTATVWKVTEEVTDEQEVEK